LRVLLEVPRKEIFDTPLRPIAESYYLSVLLKRREKGWSYVRLLPPSASSPALERVSLSDKDTMCHAMYVRGYGAVGRDTTVFFVCGGGGGGGGEGNA
jgi:hypothetical protein